MPRRIKYPVIIGTKMRKGMMIFRNRLFDGNGVDVAIVRLRQETPTGESFDDKDVQNVEVDMHFCDIESFRFFADNVNKALEKWEQEAGNET